MNGKNFRYVLMAIVMLALVGSALADADTDKIQNADWFEREIAQGVTYRYYHFTELFGGPIDLFVTDTDLNDSGISIKFPYTTSGWKTVSTYAGETPNSVSVINGNFFDVGTGECVQYFKVDGTVVSTTKPAIADGGGIAVSGGNTATILARPGSGWASLTQPSVMSSNTMVAQDDAIWPWPHTPSSEELFYYQAKHPRTCIGITDDNHLIMVAVDGRSSVSQGVTYEQLAKIMLALGCDDAVGLDGGGSTTMWIKGEPGGGVVNNPSDGSERSVGNALAIVTTNPTPTPIPLDARFISSTDPGTIVEGNTKSITMTFKNYGSVTWMRDSIFLGTSEDTGRDSGFYTSGEWISSSRVCTLNEASVAPGGTGTFTFTLTAPAVSTATIYAEAFAMSDGSSVYFGPEQNYLYITVVSDSGGGEIIIESRAGGQNVSWYSETGGWADTGSTSSAPGATAGIGSRYGSTYRSVAGSKSAFYTPYITTPGLYEIYASWPSSSNSRNPITYKMVINSVVEDTFLVDQSSNANSWHLFGTYNLSAGENSHVEMSNEDIDLSGSMFAGPVKFVPVSNVDDWLIY